MGEDEGYKEARRLLKERFGQDYRVAAAHVQGLINGPQIKNEDGIALQQFSVQLTSCTNTLEKIGYLDRLNNSDNLKKLIDRLPYPMRIKWRDNVDRIVEREARDVSIKDVNDFVTAKARATTHPIFGKISTAEKAPKFQNPKMRRNGGAAGFSSQTTKQTLKCPLCGSNHWLSRCDKFRKQSLEERQKFVKEKKLCNNCLSTGHFVRSCTKQSFCKVQGCTGTHSTFLHPKLAEDKRESEDSKRNENKRIPEDQGIKDASDGATNGYVKSRIPKYNSVTGLAVVPVKVKVAGSSRTVETYAFLDSGSNTTFCTDTLLKRLGAKGKKTKLTLTTIQGENEPIECSFVSLEVSNMEGNADIKLPMVYSRPSLPIPSEAIGKQEDVDRWPHLSGVKIATIAQDVGLLIGSDVPSALQPIEVRESNGEGPFATRTALGWTLNGPLGRESTKTPTVNSIQADSKLDRQFERFCNLEFNDNQYDPNPTMSRNDLKALRSWMKLRS
ncbi:uncharacterized protein LOC114531302 [Dendronephthya gigantea]|uniref:uncharacterized protein LOC114531302 n=1 Tax=Dendronephthya gigantea TaxID=151771 RepID=UPI00106AB871|nr:uncharacterized protein LOC114531302 [Dendronephthya gigantea]